MSIRSLRTCCTLITPHTTGNQVIAQINLLYVAVLAGRVPVVGDFVPAHMHGNPGYLPVPEVYDIPRLAETLQMPIIGWDNIKNRSSGVVEELGCWSLQETLFGKHFDTGGLYAAERQFSLGEYLITSIGSFLI